MPKLQRQNQPDGAEAYSAILCAALPRQNYANKVSTFIEVASESQAQHTQKVRMLTCLSVQANSQITTCILKS